MPKSPNDDLYVLIHSLSKAERAYFNLYSLAFAKGEAPLHLKLFDRLCLKKEYDEKEIIKELKPITKPHFAFLKNYLREQILSALVICHSGFDTEVEINSFIHRTKILIEKKMPDLAVKQIAKAKELAKGSENYIALLKISELEWKMLNMGQGVSKMKSFVESNVKELRNYLRYIKNTSEYNLLNAELSVISADNFGGYGKFYNKKIDQIANDKLLSSPQQALTFSASNNYYRIQNLLMNLLQNKNAEKSYRQQLTWVKKIEADKLKLLERSTEYINALSNLMVAQHAAGHHDSIEQTFTKGLLFVESIRMAVKSNDLLISAENFICNYTGAQVNMLNAKKTVQTIERVNSNPVLKKRLENNIVFNSNLMIAHLVLAEFGKALYYANKISNERVTSRLDIHKNVKNWLLIIHYELGNIDLLPSIARSVKKFFQKNGGLSDFEKHFFNYFENEFSQILNRREERKVFERVKQEMLKFSPRSGDFILWLDSKIQNRSLLEQLKK